VGVFHSPCGFQNLSLAKIKIPAKVLKKIRLRSPMLIEGFLLCTGHFDFRDEQTAITDPMVRHDLAFQMGETMQKVRGSSKPSVSRRPGQAGEFVRAAALPDSTGMDPFQHRSSREIQGELTRLANDLVGVSVGGKTYGNT